MGDTLDWWLLDGDWYDRKQQRAIQDLERSNASARSRTRRLQQQVEQNQATLTRRVDQLERALQAVVELEDVREELNEHVPAALVRRYARTIVMAVSGLGDLSGSAVPEPPADVLGYWLAPASLWAASIKHPQRDEQSLEEARRRDPVRADLFVAALSAIADESIDATESLERLLAIPHRGADWQRELWVAIVDGRFGLSVRTMLTDAVREAVGEVTWEQLSRATVSASVTARPVESGRRLAALADCVAPPPAQLEPSELSAPPGEGEVGNAADPEAGGDRLAELMAVIVEEGAPGEVAVLDSMTDIRRVLAGDAAIRPARAPGGRWGCWRGSDAALRRPGWLRCRPANVCG